MATAQSQFQDITEYYREMSKHVGIARYKFLRISLVSIIIGWVFRIAVQAGADPQALFPWAVGGILLVAGVEIAELEALKKLTEISISVGNDD